MIRDLRAIRAGAPVWRGAFRVVCHCLARAAPRWAGAGSPADGEVCLPWQGQDARRRVLDRRPGSREHKIVERAALPWPLDEELR